MSAAPRRRRGLLLLSLALASGGLAASEVSRKVGEVEARVGAPVPVVVAQEDLVAGKEINEGTLGGSVRWSRFRSASPRRTPSPTPLRRRGSRPRSRSPPGATSRWVTSPLPARAPVRGVACFVRVSARWRWPWPGARRWQAPRRARVWTCWSRPSPAPGPAAPSWRSRGWSCSRWAALRGGGGGFDPTAGNEAPRPRRRPRLLRVYSPPGGLPHRRPELRARDPAAAAPTGRPRPPRPLRRPPPA